MTTYTIQCKQCGATKITPFKSVQFCNSRCSGRFNGGVPHIVAEEGNKWCNKCRRMLPIEAFSLNRNSDDGHAAACKFCYSMWTRRKNGMTYHQMMEMLEAQGWLCAICGDSMRSVYDDPTLLGQRTKHLNSISIDHIIPAGEQRQLTHQICNISKSNRDMAQLVDWCRKVVKTSEQESVQHD